MQAQVAFATGLMNFESLKRLQCKTQRDSVFANHINNLQNQLQAEKQKDGQLAALKAKQTS